MMQLHRPLVPSSKTTACRWMIVLAALFVVMDLTACSKRKSAQVEDKEEEAIARTARCDY
ncbi:MAG: hypothetical protein ACREEM_00830 [Blastocatellia bacterium]